MMPNLRVVLADLYAVFLLQGAVCEVEYNYKDGAPLSKFIQDFDLMNCDITHLDAQQNQELSSDFINVEVSAFGRSFHLQLSAFPSLISEGAKLNLVHSEGTRTSDIAAQMYKGIVGDDPHSMAYGFLINRTFEGVIKTEGETFHIEPSYRYFSASSSSARQPTLHSVIYRTSDVRMSRSPDGNHSSESCQLCSVSWDSAKRPNREKGTPNRHGPTRGIDSSSKSHDPVQVVASMARDTGYVDIFKVRLHNDSGPDDSSQDRRSGDHRHRASSQHAGQPDDDHQGPNNNRSRGEPLTTFAQPSKTCLLHVLVDHTFYQNAADSDASRVIAEVVYHVEEANSVYRATDFDGDGIADNIGFIIGGLTVFETATAQNYLLSADYQDAEDFLSQVSLYNFSAYCMGLIFTYRDFDAGVLGLAWMGYPDFSGPPGGICQKQVTYRDDGLTSSLNTAMVTFLNYGTYVPRSISIASVMHELGHGFGSEHDPQTPHCSPAGQQGNFLMYSQATDGKRPNNGRFSSCSRGQIARMVASKGSQCLQSDVGRYCGNGLVEQGEECDCGTAAMCALADNCCTPQGGAGSDAECTLRRQLGRVCSPLTSPCCDEHCHIIPASSYQHCSTDNDCLRDSHCNADCPEPESLPDGTVCEGGNKRCHGGQCSQSACLYLGHRECFCSDNANDTRQSCQLCCQVDGDCLPADWLGLTMYSGQAIRKQPGSPCSNYTGLCDLQGFCVTLDTDSALDNLKTILTADDGSETLVYWLKNNWYYVILCTLGICLLMLTTKVSYDHRHYLQTLLRRRTYHIRPVTERITFTIHPGPESEGNTIVGGQQESDLQVPRPEEARV